MASTLLGETHDFYSRATIVSLVLLALLIIAGLFLSPLRARAESKHGFEAMMVSAPKSGFTMEPGSTRDVLLRFQNIGEKTWVNEGTSYVSIYTYDPKYRASDFKSDNWIDYTQAALLREDSVASGEAGSIYLTLTAPKSEGTYQETFHLAAEDTAWIPGGEFTLSINVQDGQEAEETQKHVKTSVEDGIASPETNGLSAAVLLRSAKKIIAEAGETIEYKIGVKNTGSVPWITREIVTSDYAIASAETHDASWVSSTKLVVNTGGVVKPGGLDFLSFSFTAPSSKGFHTVRYKMAVNDMVIPDFYIDIPVEVTTGSPNIKDEPLTVDETDIQSTRMIDEPTMRVALLTIDEETDWVTEISCNSDWDLIDSEGGLLGEMDKDEMARAFYKNQRYYFNRGRGIEQTYKYLRFEPKDDDAICTIENFDRRKTRGAAHALNQFRGKLELRYIPEEDEVWVINELPIEEYLYGLGETSDYSEQEFKKSLVTVARTYGLYHWERNTKHGGYYHVTSYSDDQVYFGYEYEKLNPSIKKAADATRGVTVNYNGRTALTPYFSRSDGRTRSWSEVWGGSVAWLQSVPAPYDKAAGRTLWGHGVGMSATEALDMAKHGESWEDILHYFYTDVDLNKRWN